MSQHAFFCKEGLPNYKLLSPADINQLISLSIDEGRKTLREVCTEEGPRNWENTIKPISEIHETLNRIWGAANHLCSVADNQEIRDVINKNLEQVSSFWTDFSQNKILYKIFANLRRGISKATHPQQHKVLCDYIRDFELAGANLEDDTQINFKKNTIELNKLAQKFSENLLDSTKATVIEVVLNKDGKPRKIGSGKTKGAGCFAKIKWEHLREFIKEDDDILVGRVWLRSVGALNQKKGTRKKLKTTPSKVANPQSAPLQNPRLIKSKSSKPSNAQNQKLEPSQPEKMEGDDYDPPPLFASFGEIKKY